MQFFTLWPLSLLRKLMLPITLLRPSTAAKFEWSAGHGACVCPLSLLTKRGNTVLLYRLWVRHSLPIFLICSWTSRGKHFTFFLTLPITRAPVMCPLSVVRRRPMLIEQLFVSSYRTGFPSGKVTCLPIREQPQGKRGRHSPNHWIHTIPPDNAKQAWPMKECWIKCFHCKRTHEAAAYRGSSALARNVFIEPYGLAFHHNAYLYSDFTVLCLGHYKPTSDYSPTATSWLFMNVSKLHTDFPNKWKNKQCLEQAIMVLNPTAAFSTRRFSVYKVCCDCTYDHHQFLISRCIL